jgi:hypothetical protein
MTDISTVNGTEYLSLEALATLAGVSYDDALAEYTSQQQVRPGRFVIPQSWTRGCKEMQAKHGTRDLDELLARIRADRSGS